jgi:phosphatidylglycerophosphate synthase
LTRKLANTSTTPAHLGAARMLLGLAAAACLAVPGYLAGILAATLYFLSRVLDTVAADLSRAAVVAGMRGRKVDVIGDIVVLVTIIVALGSRLAVKEAYVLMAVAVVGIAISAWVSYRRLFRWEWRSHDPFVLTWDRRNRAFV